MSQRPLTLTIISILPGLSRGLCRAVIPSQCSHWRGNPSFPLWGNGLPRQSVPQGHVLRGADWLAMTECVGDGVLDVPSARRCRAGNGLPRQCEHWLAMTRCVGRDPCVPPQNTAFVPAGHTGPALQGGSTDSRRKKRKPLRAFFFAFRVKL